MFPEIKNIKETIATRELKFVFSNGSIEDAIVKIGKPYAINENGDHLCPYEVSSATYSHMFGMVGIDSFQALQLALSTIQSELLHWARKKNGSFEILGEPGTGLENKNA